MMEGTYSYDQGYTPWNPPPYQHHAPQYNVYQSNGFGDAYYGYEDPPPPYSPVQGNFEDIIQVLLQERKEFWETQRRLEAQLATVTKLVTRLVTLSVASTSITSQPLNSGDLPSQALSIPRRSIPTLFLCANQEGREDAPLNEEDVETLNHEEVLVKFGWPTPRRGTSRLGVGWLSGGILGYGFECGWELVEVGSVAPRREVTRLGVGEVSVGK
ncbi:hypothetical protein PIB30_067276 [Stylosanthes scabra]|uniref:Uncharacterized protein n=1 Tax=Stylosanthes scabra TaxID=79078 RepID=A0ABU6YMW9_9FABA|nr:hypothetical protein [Stylosanthes scabra]